MIEIVKQYGRLKVLDESELVVELEEQTAFDSLQAKLAEAFAGEVDLELRKKG